MGLAMHRSACASAPVGRHLVVINMQPTGADAEADLCIAKPIGQVLSEDVTLDL